MSSPWWAEAFRAGYLDLYAHRDLDSARAEARFLVERGLRGRVLDLCCGWGRHLAALSELGLDACGLDYSAELLQRAVAGHGGALAGRVVRGDARALPFRTGAFDGVVSLFSSFGYFGDEGDRAVIAGAARVLRPGGVLFLDLMNPTSVRARLVPASTREQDGNVIEERRTLTDGGRRVEKIVRVRLSDGSERRWREDVRLYELAEIESLATEAGLALRDAAGAFTGETYGPAAPRMIVRLARPG
jgi:SAM-dependent methyltransferase